jgi:HD-like signal output (HDOD) protein
MSTSSRSPIQPNHVSAGESGSRLVRAGVKRRILFVDDEPAILEGLRSVLRAQRHEWEMVFALGGASALEQVARSEFDVVVTDMRMPSVGGAEVLRQVKTLQPRCVRIVLSGQTDAEAAMKTVFMAHQFLAKPSNVDELRGVVTRACGLQELLSSDELRALAGDVTLLPAAPRTYLAISEVLADPNGSLTNVVRIVERDPALCAKILQIVNSAFFGLPRKVSSVSQATSYLGALTMRNLALAMESVSASAQTRLPLSRRELLEFQTNSLLVAMLGRHWFAADRRRADEAFVAGMLRDMGHLVLLSRGAGASDTSCHPALSAYLMGLWGIPHAVLEPVAFHEEPELVEHDQLEVVDVVHLADRVGAELVPSPFQPPPPPLDRERLGRLGVTPEILDHFRADAEALLVHTRELLR